MQNHGQIARAFAAWQRAHERLCEAELRLQAATLAHQHGSAPKPDALRQEVLGLKAEQEWRYDIAADALRKKNTPVAVDAAAAIAPRPNLRGGPAAQLA
jgi:hypothetical protein